MAVLLSLMIGSSAEDFELYKADWGSSKKLELKSDVLLENVRSVVKQLQVGICLRHLLVSSYNLKCMSFTLCSVVKEAQSA